MLLNELFENAHNWGPPTHNHGLEGSGDEYWRTITDPKEAASAALKEWKRLRRDRKYLPQQLIDFANEVFRERKLVVDKEQYLKHFRELAIKRKLIDETI